MNSGNVNLDMLKDLGASGYEHARVLGELNLRTWERLVEKQLETFGLLIDTANAQIKLASETKDLSEVVTAQTELGRKLSEDLLAKGRESLAMAGDFHEEYKRWMENGISQFTAKASKTTKQSA